MSDDEQKPVVEVQILLNQKPYKCLKLMPGVSGIGRDASCVLHLSSDHVSRIHAELNISTTEIRVRDRGSRNGILVNGQRVQEAALKASSVLRITDFELRFRYLSNSTYEGWEDYAQPEGFSEQDDWAPSTMPEEIDNTPLPLAQGSLLNKLASRSSLGAAAPKPLANERSWADFAREFSSATEPLKPTNKDTILHNYSEYSDTADDSAEVSQGPSLLFELHEEGNRRLHSDQRGRVGVQIIVALGEQVHDVHLIPPGESFWWGGGFGVTHLWRAPDDQNFPMIIHGRESEFCVQIPQDPAWKMFRRGKTQAGLYRSGRFVGCDGEYGEQIEISNGAYTFYIRCIRMPEPTPVGRSVHAFRISQSMITAMAYALLLHAIVLLLPRPRVDMPEVHVANVQPFVFISLEPSPTIEDSPPQKEAEPEPSIVPTPPVPKRPPKLDARLRRQPRARSTKTTPPEGEQIEDAEPKPSRPPLQAVSVSNFKISGMFSHAPDHTTGEAATKYGVRRGLGTIGAPIVRATSGLSDIAPLGSLSRKSVARVVHKHAASVYRCYERIREGFPSAEGRVMMSWIVNATGRVGQTRVDSDSVGSPGLVRCLRDELRRWVFPAPKGGAAQVRYTFSFVNPGI